MYTWDANGNSMTIDGVGLTYDALDRLVEQNSSGAYSQIAYGSTGEKLALMNGQTLQKAFIPLAGGLSEAVYTPSGLSNYRHKDWLGSARLDSTPARAVSSTTAYGPFGETYAQSGTGDSSFTGQNQDSISGLYDFLYREYSTQGRWPSPDPAGLAAVSLDAPQSWNRYAYVLNNPLSNVDPLGLTCVDSNGEAEEGVSSEKKCDKAGGTWIKPESTSVEVKATPLPNGDTTWDWTVTFATTFFTVPYRKSKEGFVACWNRAASDTLVGLGAPREATPVIETTLGTAGANGLFYSIKSIWAMGNWVRPSSYLAKAAGLGSAGVRAARIAGRELAQL